MKYNNTNEEMENGSLNENQNRKQRKQGKEREKFLHRKIHAMHVLIKKRKQAAMI